ncbi:retropepsin-like aspartic protease [Cyanobium sp. CH-040]|uniref:retropepsin-like aspartic protease n=1 Tax=Cyanobium sp. CH-040 TaxID=2823708 RepID=UPI0020CC4450|nr:aspartyl protease family protein [Cyanobium sp. CH-040]MCP9926606.1 clan AA aspartic protease [Cyanobium sp. CH-040]
MGKLRWILQRRLASALAVPLLALLPATATPSVSAKTRDAAALIQVKGAPLRAGLLQGSASAPLVRAAGGDTPVLSFRTSGPGSSAEPVRFLVDTGASNTLVSPALVRRLALASTPIPADQFGLVGAGRSCADLNPQRTTLPTLRLSGGAGLLEIRGAEALVLATGGLPEGVDGVLGAPLLRQLPLWVDPPAGRLALGSPAVVAAERQAAAAPGAATLLPLRWSGGVPLLPLTTPAGSMPALADTGAEGLFITPALGRRLTAGAAPQPVRIAGFCGLQRAQRFSVSGIGLAAGAPARPAEVIVTDDPIFASVGAEAIVGQELLRHHRQFWRLDQQPPSLLLW